MKFGFLIVHLLVFLSAAHAQVVDQTECITAPGLKDIFDITPPTCFTEDERLQRCIDLNFQLGEARGSRTDVSLLPLDEIEKCELDVVKITDLVLRDRCLEILSNSFQNGYKGGSVLYIDPSKGSDFLVEEPNLESIDDLKIMLPAGAKGKFRVHVILKNKTEAIYDIESGDGPTPKIKSQINKIGPGSYSGYVLVDRVTMFNSGISIINENLNLVHNQDFILHSFKLGGGSELAPTVTTAFRMTYSNTEVNSDVTPLSFGGMYRYEGQDKHGFDHNFGVGLNAGPVIHSQTGTASEVRPGITARFIVGF